MASRSSIPTAGISSGGRAVGAGGGPASSTAGSTTGPHPAWLPDAAFAAVGRRRVVVRGDGALVGTVAAEVAAATATHGGSFTRLEAGSGVSDADLVLTLAEDDPTHHPTADSPAADNDIPLDGHAPTNQNVVVGGDGSRAVSYTHLTLPTIR
ncbi:hypothetical protein HGK34_22315, partial [Myceligenerans sp. I2]|nr:hypothetical protein [Myceligenerans indicum]